MELPIHHVQLLNCEIRNAGSNAAPPNNTNAISAFGGSNYAFIGGSCHDGPSYCFYINGNNHLIDGMDIYNMGAYGIHNNESDGSKTIESMTFRNNRIHNTGGTFSGGIVVSAANAAHNVKIYNNIIYDGPNEGIQLAGNDHNTQVYNNTMNS